MSWGLVGTPPKQPQNILPSIASAGLTKPVPAWFLETISLLVDEGSPVFTPTRLATCSWVQYHEAAMFPTNFIAIGDSTMGLNPIYGQGCSKIMVSLLLLDRMLREQQYDQSLSPLFAKQFFHELKTRTRGMWVSSKYEDYQRSTAGPSTGETRQNGKLVRWANRLVRQAARKDVKVARVLSSIGHVFALESALMRPGILLKILWAQITQSTSGKTELRLL
ncbi:hypothetical protein BDV98DRAFT_57173 [Pterulicium gracile]|uniref:Squalene monooxygenase n=1 Tax=Pterulicium gracile TaxID=1884261 RepID=A0A5C3QNZ6_9AGAR|nr:hypothetical protein BDV98DRAFT_57173 [Pterula gracilis]